MKRKSLIIVIVALAAVLMLASFVLQIFFWGPFGEPPFQGGMNCGPEQRFRFSVNIGSADDFVDFLKDHQVEVFFTDSAITEDGLIPLRGLDGKIVNMESLKEKITVETSKAILSCERIYSIDFGWTDFNESYPWNVWIRASETGHVSVRVCAGI